MRYADLDGMLGYYKDQTNTVCGTCPSEFKMNDSRHFDVFLSHNGKDKPIAVALEGLSSSRSCAVLIGASGYGGWHKREMEAALTRQGPEYPVIPVLIPGAPDRTELGAFISLLTWVDLRSGVHDAAAIDRLIWGITGERPKDAVNKNTPLKVRAPIKTPLKSRGARAHRPWPRVLLGILNHLQRGNERFHIKNPKNGPAEDGTISCVQLPAMPQELWQTSGIVFRIIGDDEPCRSSL